MSVAERRRMAREELQAHLTAERLVQEAYDKASAIVAEAREKGAAEAAAAGRQARAEADAQLTARWVALRQAEGKQLGELSDRVLTLAVLLAERLVGATLEIAPERIASMVDVVIAEARGVRRAVIYAHPLDAEVIRQQFERSGVDVSCYSVQGDEALGRGELRLQTDVGVILAKPADRLAMLAKVVRDANLAP